MKKCTVCGDVVESQIIPANHVPLFIIAGCVLAVIIIIIICIVAKKRKGEAALREALPAKQAKKKPVKSK